MDKCYNSHHSCGYFLAIKALAAPLDVWGFIISTAEKLLFIILSFSPAQWLSIQAFQRDAFDSNAINWKIKYKIALCKRHRQKDSRHGIIERARQMYQIDRTRVDFSIRSVRKCLEQHEQCSEKLFIFLKTSTDAISDVFVVLSSNIFVCSWMLKRNLCAMGRKRRGRSFTVKREFIISCAQKDTCAEIERWNMMS